jgi:hypothetical protein
MLIYFIPYANSNEIDRSELGWLQTQERGWGCESESEFSEINYDKSGMSILVKWDVYHLVSTNWVA